MPIAAAFERDGEEGFRAREAEVVGALLEGADGGAIALGGGSVLSPRIRAALDRHVVVWLQVDADEAWRRIAHCDRPLATSAEDVAAPAGGAPAALRGAGRRGGPAGRPDADRAAPCRRVTALAELPAGTKLLWAASASGEYPVLVGRGLLESGWWPLQGRRFCVSDAAVGAALRRAAGTAGGDRRSRARRGGEDAGRGRAGPARAGPRRDDPRGPRGRPRRRRRRRPRRLLRPPLPARRAGGPGADHAGRPGRLRLRRQDRRRPARGQELRRRLPPAGGGARRHRRRSRRCRRRSSPPASSRC